MKGMVVYVYSLVLPSDSVELFFLLDIIWNESVVIRSFLLVTTKTGILLSQ